MGQETQAAEGQQQDDQDDQKRKPYGPDEVLLDGTGVRHGAQRRTVQEDACVGVCGLECLAFLVEEPGKAGGGSRIGLFEAGREEGHGHRAVGAEEVAILDGKVAHASFLSPCGQDFPQKDVAQVERVGTDQLGGLAGHVGLEEFDIADHLRFDGFGLQGGCKGLVKRSVDERRQMLETVIHGTERHGRVEGTEDIPDVTARGIAFQQSFDVFVDIPAQGPGIHRLVGRSRPDLDENLVFQADVAESELALKAGTGQQLGHVLLVAEARTEEQEDQHADGQQGVHDSLVAAEVSV